MKSVTILVAILFSILWLWIGPAAAADPTVSSEGAQEITFFHPSGVRGFIVYDVAPDRSLNALSYGKKSYDLSSPLGLPLTVDVERINVKDDPLNFKKLLDESESDYLEIFSVQRALTYGQKSTLSSLNVGSSDISMVVATAKYQATEKFTANLSTGVAQTSEEKRGTTSSNLGYELDISGHYQIAPGLGFSVGAGYATNIDSISDPVQKEDDKRSWSLISKFRLKF
jgi:hypothetical protein